jgi:L-threonylcarbamoyladenylate synthase
MTNDIKKSLEILNKGGIILYPTDTIWGLGCDATNFEAVKRIYSVKKREDSKSMLVLLDSEKFLNFYIKEVPEIAYQLIEVSDRPLTIIYPGARNLAPNLIASDGSIGIRIPNDEFCRQLISNFKKPVISTSANISGGKSPTNFNEISKEIINAVDFVVEWRQDDLSKSQPSSIIKLSSKGEVEIIRK